MIMYMARVKTIVQLSTELRELVDAEAQRLGISRSALIRLAIEAYLEEASQAAITRRIVEGYRRIPPGTPDEWGDVEAMADRSTRELLEREDAEERAGGHPPW